MNTRDEQGKIIDVGTEKSIPKDPEREKALREAYEMGRMDELEALGTTDIVSERIRTPGALVGRAKNAEERAAYYKGVIGHLVNMGSTHAMILMSNVTNLSHEKREKYGDEVRKQLSPPKVKIIKRKGEERKVDNQSLQGLVDKAYWEGIEQGILGNLMVSQRIEDQESIVQEIKKKEAIDANERLPDSKMT